MFSFEILIPKLPYNTVHCLEFSLAVLSYSQHLCSSFKSSFEGNWLIWQAELLGQIQMDLNVIPSWADVG